MSTNHSRFPKCPDCGRRVCKSGETRCALCRRRVEKKGHILARQMKRRAELAELLPVGSEWGRYVVEGFPVFQKLEGTKKRAWWINVRCKCGSEPKFAWCVNLLRGAVQSCGCLMAEKVRERMTTHGGTGTKLFSVWHGMLSRCYSMKPSACYYHLYRGKGITVCDAWRTDFTTFRDWALANGYHPGLAIDRIDGSGNYSPENCRFATPKEQSRNTSRNRQMAAFGEMKTVAEWAEDPRCVVGLGTLRARLDYGWEPEDAVACPVMSREESGHHAYTVRR